MFPARGLGDLAGVGAPDAALATATTMLLLLPGPRNHAPAAAGPRSHPPAAAGTTKLSSGATGRSCDALPEPHDAPVTLMEALWLHFDVHFSSHCGLFSRPFRKRVAFAENARRVHGSSSFEVPASQNPWFV